MGILSNLTHSATPVKLCKKSGEKNNVKLTTAYLSMELIIYGSLMKTLRIHVISIAGQDQTDTSYTSGGIVKRKVFSFINFCFIG